VDPQEELIRLHVLQIRLQFDSQAEVIQELNKAGFGRTRIAELLGTTPGTVGVALARTKKQATKKK
jgi:IS30 family transposase